MDKYTERKRIGEIIRNLRKSQNLTQDELAEAASITRANLSSIERGKYSAGFDILSRIADALGMKVVIL